MRRSHVLAVPVLLAVALAGVACEDATEGQEVFQATLSGANEVPVRSTAGNGTAQVIIDGDRVHFALEIDDIQNVVAAHIHIAAPGVNGPVRRTFFSGTARSTSDKHILAEGTFTAPDAGSPISFADLLSAIRAGNTYVNVHTTQFPGGEIRGQLQRVSLD